MTEVEKTKATIDALLELQAVRSAARMAPITNLSSYFECLSEVGFDLGTLNALNRMGFWHRCAETGAYTFHA